MDADEVVGKRIEALRSEAGLNQAELSDQLRKAGVNWSQGTLSRVESGARPVRFTEAFTVASVLGVDAVDLAPDGGGLVHVYRADLEALSKRHDSLRAAEFLFRGSVASVEMMRLLVELSEGGRGPYVLHSSVSSIVSWAAGHCKTSVEVLLRLVGIPDGVSRAEFQQASDNVRQFLEDWSAGETENSSWSQDLLEWVNDQVEYGPGDPDRLEWGRREEWELTLLEQFRNDAIDRLFAEYFPFVQQPERWPRGAGVKQNPPVVEGIDSSELDDRVNRRHKRKSTGGFDGG